MARPRPARIPALLVLAGAILPPLTGAAAATPVAGPLPDSVLAVVGAHREVSVALFKRSWKQVVPPARPDSLTPEGVRKFLDLLIDKEAVGEAAERETWTWSDKEREGFAGLRDRLTVGAVLDSSLQNMRRRLGARGD